MVTIEDVSDQAALCEAMCACDGPAVAKAATDLVISGRAAVLERACKQCAHLCAPAHARAVVDALTGPRGPAQRNRDTARNRARAKLSGLADVVATIMAGARTQGRTAERVPRDTKELRDAVDAILNSRTGTQVVPNITLLPSRPNMAWASVVALARAATRSRALQEPLVVNERLRSLFGVAEDGAEAAAQGAVAQGAVALRRKGGRNGSGAAASASSDDSVWDVDAKLSILWSFSRERGSDPNVEPHAPALGDRIVACSALKPVKRDGRVACVLATP